MSHSDPLASKPASARSGNIWPGDWDVVVVGGGHAGSEAALATARAGLRTLLLTTNVDRIGWMSCNPAIGGVGKTHLVAEIDALGGAMARNADGAGVHTKLLNASRGPAVQALRVQCDKLAYATGLRETVESQPRLQVMQGTVTRLWLAGSQVNGVETNLGLRLEARTVILTAGTFMAAICHYGDRREAGGRAGDSPAAAMADFFGGHRIATLRHKTGTCPRLDCRAIDWSALEVDPGLRPPPSISTHPPVQRLKQMDCHATWTTPATHTLIRAALDRSPLFRGKIDGVGPRYCPSIEDKVIRFANRERHLLVLEREGWRTGEVYLSGLSTSLPADVQLAVVRSVPGLKAAEIVRFGYAVEYDTVDPRQLGTDLQMLDIGGLFLAGQVNGTSGYEEAAAQGLVAAIGAIAKVRGDQPPVLDRAESYLGVLVDDLITNGGGEPYRMFTSRAEHRLSLRPGNADLRLARLGRRFDLITDQQLEAVETRRQTLEAAWLHLGTTEVRPDIATLGLLSTFSDGGLDGPTPLALLLRRPAVSLSDLAPWLPAQLQPGTPECVLNERDVDELTARARYAGYVAREQTCRDRVARNGTRSIPADLDYRAVGALNAEAIEVLEMARPTTLAQAGRVRGMTPAALQALAMHLEARRRKADAVVQRQEPDAGSQV